MPQTDLFDGLRCDDLSDDCHELNTLLTCNVVTGGSIIGRIQKLLNQEVDIHIAEQEVVICNSGRATVLVCSLINRLLLLRRKSATCDGWHI